MSAYNFQAVVGDQRTAWSTRLYDPGRNNNLAGLTVTFAMYTSSGTVYLAATSTGISIQPTQTFTADASTDKITCVAHGVKAGWEVIVSTSALDLPAGLLTTARYFAKDITPNTFRLSLEPNGAMVDITNAGTGTHSIAVIGHVQYSPALAAVATAGTYKGKFVVTESTLTDTYPNDAGKIGVFIVAAN